MYCGRCGTQNDDNARFCSECGADLSPVNPAAVPVLERKVVFSASGFNSDDIACCGKCYSLYPAGNEKTFR